MTECAGLVRIQMSKEGTVAPDLYTTGGPHTYVTVGVTQPLTRINKGACSLGGIPYGLCTHGFSASSLRSLTRTAVRTGLWEKLFCGLCSDLVIEGHGLVAGK